MSISRSYLVTLAVRHCGSEAVTKHVADVTARRCMLTVLKPVLKVHTLSALETII